MLFLSKSEDPRVSSEVLSCISAMFVLVLQTPDALREGSQNLKLH